MATEHVVAWTCTEFEGNIYITSPTVHLAETTTNDFQDEERNKPRAKDRCGGRFGGMGVRADVRARRMLAERDWTRTMGWLMCCTESHVCTLCVPIPWRERLFVRLGWVRGETKRGHARHSIPTYACRSLSLRSCSLSTCSSIGRYKGPGAGRRRHYDQDLQV